MSASIDGFSLEDVGLYISLAASWRDVPRQQRAIAQRPGRIGGLDLTGGTPQVDPRSLELIGVQRGVDRTELLARTDDLKRRVGRRSVEIVLLDNPTRYFLGRLEQVNVTPIAPTFTSRAHRIRLSFVCIDPRAYDLTATVVAFSTATPMPTGTAPVGPVIRIDNPNAPSILYRDYAGNVKGSLALSTTGLAWVEIDNRRMTITGSDGSNRTNDLVSGNFLDLDPADGNAAGTQHPTLEVTGGTGTATYEKAWW